MNDLNLFISVEGDNVYLVDDNCTRLKRGGQAFENTDRSEMHITFIKFNHCL